MSSGDGQWLTEICCYQEKIKSQLEKMFWKFHLDTAGIDTLLAKEDVTLKEVLDKEDILQECKTQNAKLIDFLMQDDILKELVHLVVEEPTEHVEETLKYKYMNLACEVLTSDVEAVLDKIANTQELLDILWAYVDTSSTLNPLVTSFFSKVFTHLVYRKGEETFVYLKSHDAVNKLLVHIEISAIMELFVNFLKYTATEDSQMRLETSRWLNDCQLIDKLIQLLHPSKSEEIHYNVSQLLSDLIRISRDTISQEVGSEEDPLLLTFESKETIETLFSMILEHFELPNSDSTIVNGISIVTTLLEIKRPTVEGMEELITQQDIERIAHGVHSTIDVLGRKFKDLHKILIKPLNTAPMEMTYGMLDPPLGKVRINIASLVTTAVTANTRIINDELAKTDILKTLLDLFACYEWNNFLHSHVQECIRAILYSENLTYAVDIETLNAKDEDSKDNLNEDGVKKNGVNDDGLHKDVINKDDVIEDSTNVLLKHLFGDCNVIERCLELWESNEIAEKSGKPRKGYMGHLINIINEIVHAKEKGPNYEAINSIINNTSEDVQKEWGELISTSLAEINKKSMCSPVNVFDTDIDSPERIAPYEGTLQQAFENYQVQPMSTEFIESFGYDENLDEAELLKNPFTDVGKIDFSINANAISDNENLFNNICDQKIKGFDDNDDGEEEDIWEERQLAFASPTQPRQSKNAIASDSDSSNEDESEVKEPPSKESDEKMEVDSEWTANFDNFGMDVQNNDTSNWANKVTSKPNNSSLTNDANFADFTNISKFEISGSLPVAMETEGMKSIGSSTAYEVTMDTVDCTERNTSVAATTTTATEVRGYVVIDSTAVSTPTSDEKSIDVISSHVTSITVKSTRSKNSDLANKEISSVPLQQHTMNHVEVESNQDANDSPNSAPINTTPTKAAENLLATNTSTILLTENYENLSNNQSSLIEVERAKDVKT